MKYRSDNVEKVRKLQALAQDQAGLPEGDLAAKLAREMMQKHCIEESEVLLSEGDEGLLDEVFSIESQQDWRRFLLSVVCDHLECKMVYYDGSPLVRLFGYNKDIERSRYVYAVCLKQIEAEAKRYYKEMLRGEVVAGFLSKGEALEHRKDFCFSAVFAIRDRFAAERRKEQLGGVYALVLRKSSKVEQFFEKNTGGLKGTKNLQKEVNPYGYSVGMGIKLVPGIK